MEQKQVFCWKHKSLKLTANIHTAGSSGKRLRYHRNSLLSSAGIRVNCVTVTQFPVKTTVYFYSSVDKMNVKRVKSNFAAVRGSSSLFGRQVGMNLLASLLHCFNLSFSRLC